MPYPLARIVADEEDETLFIEILIEEKYLKIKLSELKRMIDIASEKVHSERYYRENVYHQLDGETEEQE
ncbi:MAG: hypothetical protein GC137_10765 [Alphaproteobacteria bacterium]|nr:hypothetical protein [Alphaproteobacteria bacterium]